MHHKTVTRAAIVAYEAELNVIIHARSGKLQLNLSPSSVLIVVEDEGPGILDISLAMQEGYSTAPPAVREMGYGAGMGLPNINRCADSLILQSEVGVGTRLEILLHYQVSEARNMMSEKYRHSVFLKHEKCIGCVNCIKQCPTEAIRVRQGKAVISEERCIDCGECIRACPNLAKAVLTDGLLALDRFPYKIALVPPSFYGQFKKGTTICQVHAALRQVGFDHIMDVAFAAENCF